MTKSVKKQSNDGGDGPARPDTKRCYEASVSRISVMLAQTANEAGYNLQKQLQNHTQTQYNKADISSGKMWITK